MSPAQPKPDISNNAIDRHRFFLEKAYQEREKSDDPKAKLVDSSGVGCVIVVRDRIIVRSANIVPPMLDIKQLIPDGEISEIDRYNVIEHAERSAIYTALASGKSLKTAKIYCTRFPCSDCARAIVWSGITEAIFSEDIAIDQKWTDSQTAARRILKSAGIDILILND